MSKKDVVKAFKALLRITEKTFEGDKRALFEAKQKIQMEFRKELEPETQVEDKLKIASEVGNILKHQVVQLSKKQDSDNYQLKLRKETVKLDNVIFKEDAIMPPPRTKRCKPGTS